MEKNNIKNLLNLFNSLYLTYIFNEQTIIVKYNYPTYALDMMFHTTPTILIGQFGIRVIIKVSINHIRVLANS